GSQISADVDGQQYAGFDGFGIDRIARFGHEHDAFGETVAGARQPHDFFLAERRYPIQLDSALAQQKYGAGIILLIENTLAGHERTHPGVTEHLYVLRVG